MSAGLCINVSVSRLILAKTVSLLISMGRHLLRLSYLGSSLKKLDKTHREVTLGKVQ